MEINLNPGFFLPASEYFRRHKDVQKRHSGSLSPLLEALQPATNFELNWWGDRQWLQADWDWEAFLAPILAHSH